MSYETMSRRYFGESVPDDRREGVAQMIIGIGGFGLFCLVAAVVLVMWCQGCI